MTIQPKAAATIVVLRDCTDGFEVLMLKRSRKASFFPHAWVFPGGRVDSTDSKVVASGDIFGLDDSHRDYAVAAIRECFEESGVWLGNGQPTRGFRDALNSGEQSFNDAPHMIADLTRLEQWAHWITPEAEPKRYDTRFFVASLGGHGAGQGDHDRVETVDMMWVRPQDAVVPGRFFLAPPTLITLLELSEYSSTEAVMSAARMRDVQPIVPVAIHDQSGDLAICLPGDEAHPNCQRVCNFVRVVLRGSQWVVNQ